MTALSRLGIDEVQLPYDEYRQQARNADVLLWRPTSLWGHVIAAGTQGPWCHAAGVVWHRNRLCSVQYREGVGGYAVPTSTEINQWPGRADVFRVARLDEVQRDDIADTMFGTLGGPYGWGRIGAIALHSVLILRWLHNTPRVGDWLHRQASRTTANICSSHVDNSYRRHGVLFTRRPSGLVTPNDLGRSAVLDYVGTLV